jgi:3-deoxy-7-phosphoheptulonate synthase
MLIVMHHKAARADIRKVEKAIRDMGYRPVAMPGAERTAIGVLGNEGWVDEAPFANIQGILDIIHVTKPYKLVSRDFYPADTEVRLGRGVKVGGRKPFLAIAGPCAVEGRSQIIKVARYLMKLGVPVLRGGAYKPRTSVHSFQGMREEGIELLNEVRLETGILVATEVMSPDQVGYVSQRADILQVGTRNMQNFDLLKELGKVKNPVILKRGLSATMEEWVASAEYIMVGGNPNIVLCERGIRTFETATRNTADLAIIPLVKSITHLPVIFDPSHATGVRALVAPMALASVMAGAHGMMVEVHPDPDRATSDGQQTLDFAAFGKLYRQALKLSAFARKLR